MTENDEKAVRSLTKLMGDIWLNNEQKLTYGQNLEKTFLGKCTFLQHFRLVLALALKLYLEVKNVTEDGGWPINGIRGLKKQ